MLFCTLKSTVALFALFVVVDVAILLLALGYLIRTPSGHPNEGLITAGGFFAILTGFLAWYNGYAGIADSSNTWLLVPVVHFPWSEKGRRGRERRDASPA